MPIDDEQNSLISAFIENCGGENKPHIFELVFDVQCERVIWETQAERTAKRLGISLECQDGHQLGIDLPYEEAEKRLYLAMGSAQDYARLTDAVKKHFEGPTQAELDAYISAMADDFREIDAERKKPPVDDDDPFPPDRLCVDNQCDRQNFEHARPFNTNAHAPTSKTPNPVL